MAQTKDINYRELRDAYVELMARTIRPNGFLTLVTNGEGPTLGIRKDLKACSPVLIGHCWGRDGRSWRKTSGPKVCSSSNMLREKSTPTACCDCRPMTRTIFT